MNIQFSVFIFSSLAVLALVVFAVFKWMEIADGETGLKNKIAFVGLVTGIIAIVFCSVLALFKAGEIENDNKAALISNVEQKYEVDDIRLEAFGTVTYPEIIKEQKIHVTVDGETYLFYLTQNKETWEPTLSDPPINGGNPMDSPLKAEDLLK